MQGALRFALLCRRNFVGASRFALRPSRRAKNRLKAPPPLRSSFFSLRLRGERIPKSPESKTTLWSSRAISFFFRMKKTELRRAPSHPGGGGAGVRELSVHGGFPIFFFEGEKKTYRRFLVLQPQSKQEEPQGGLRSMAITLLFFFPHFVGDPLFFFAGEKTISSERGYFFSKEKNRATRYALRRGPSSFFPKKRQTEGTLREGGWGGEGCYFFFIR